MAGATLKKRISGTEADNAILGQLRDGFVLSAADFENQHRIRGLQGINCRRFIRDINLGNIIGVEVIKIPGSRTHLYARKGLIEENPEVIRVKIASLERE